MRQQSLMMTCLLAASWAHAAAPAQRILEAAGVQGGLIVHLGCGDGTLTAALRANERYLVHGLDADPANVAKARAHLQSLGLYGVVSVDLLDPQRLPYVDNLANLAVVESSAGVAVDEVMRVLVPGGVALLGGEKRVKPRPAAMDDWTHFLHGPDNNAVSRDRLVGIPRSIQWVAEPRWGRSHEELASLSAAVIANGRLFYIVDEAPLASIRFLGDWKLVARDAFNGTLLWKRPIPRWTDHLRHFRAGPAHLARRLVAAGDTVYVTADLAGPVLALDAATGEVRREFQGTEATEEILVSDGVLYLVAGTSELYRRGGGLSQRFEPEPSAFRYVAARAADSGQPLWKRDLAKENVLPLSLAVRGSRAYFQSTSHVVCLDARSGDEVWRTPRPTPARRMSFSAPTVVATDEVLLVADRDTGIAEENQPSTGRVEWAVHGWNEKGFARTPTCTLKAYSAADGKELWAAKCKEGYNSPVDVFAIGNVAYVGPDFRGLDLKTGQPVRQIDTQAPRVGMAHHRCYRDKATERFILTGKSGIEVLGIEEGRWLANNSWVRGTCQYGILPANGLIYAPPDACACFLTVKAPGFFAAAPPRDKTGHLPFPAQPVLEKGALFGKPLEAAAATASDWPMYRHDPLRSGAASCTLPAAVAEQWTVRLGGRLTQPAVAGGRVFVASIDAHTVHALDAESGKEAWRFTAGGRIDSAPTIYKSRVIFGSADGWVYCVGAADGTLAWRFRAAPQDRRVSAYGQLESVWPVPGAVLVQDDTLYVTAGRSSYTDGGIVLYRLRPETGEELSRTVLYHLDPETGAQLVPEARFNMEGTTNDVLTSDGETVYLKYFGFDREGKRTSASKPHLFSITSLLGEEWFVRTYWVLGEGQPGAGWAGWADAAHAFPFGRILCFTDKTIYGYGRERIAGGPVGHKADTYRLFAMDRRAPAPTPKAKARAKGQQAAAPPHEVLWSDPASLTVRAMVLAGERLAVAGPVDLAKRDPDILAFTNADEALAAFTGGKGIALRILAAADGKVLSECALGAMPAFDGLAAAGGRLYLATLTGQVVCLGAPK